MGDNRYHDLLGLDATIEQPTYYELLKVAPKEVTTEVVEKSYKEQMTKLQQNKSPKHKGFIEFLKDELRNAKLTLTNESRRKEYDATLDTKHLEAFKQIVSPLLALGEVPKRVFDTLVLTGVSKHGLTEASAQQIITEMATAANATIQLQEPAPAPPPPPPVADFAHLDDSSFAAEAPPPPPPPPPPAPVEGEEVAFSDALDDTGRASSHAPAANSYYGSGAPAYPAPAEPQSPSPRMSRFEGGPRATPAPPSDAGGPSISSRIQRGRFYDSGELSSPPAPATPSRTSSDRFTPRSPGKSPSDSDWQRRSGTPSRTPSDSDWQRRGGGSPDESGRRRAGGGGATEPPPPPWQQPAQAGPWFQRDSAPPPAAPRGPLSPEHAKVADEARKTYNGGIKLAKLAIAAHEALAAYFPKNAEPILRINGVSYEEAFRTENKMLKEALPQFKRALEKLGAIPGVFPDDLRVRSENNMRAIELYMKEWKELKFKLEFQGASKSEMARLWSDYARAKRLESLKQEIEKPSEYA